VAPLKIYISTNDTLSHLSTINLNVSRQPKRIFKIQKFSRKIYGVPPVINVRNLVFYFSKSNNALYRKMSYLVKVASYRGVYVVKISHPQLKPVFEIFMKISEEK